MSRYTLIHCIFNSVSPGSRGLNRQGDHLVRLVSRTSRRSAIPTYATLEKLPEEKLRGIARSLGVQLMSAETA